MNPRAIVIPALALLYASAAHAGWSIGAVTVKLSPAWLGPMAAAADAGDGAVVTWQERATFGAPGVLRSQHLLASGDPDPAWPAEGALLSDFPAQRHSLRAVADGSGGAYVLWLQGDTIRVSRITPAGGRADGWPVEGVSLGRTIGIDHADATADGAGGLYVVFATSLDSDNAVVLAHLGPDAGPGPGWVTSARSLTPSTGSVFFSARLARSAGGGLWVCWSDWGFDCHRLMRLQADGSPAPGWAANGLAVANWNGASLLNYYPVSLPMLASVTDADAGGAYLLLQAPPGGGPTNELNLVRVDAAGSTVTSRVLTAHVEPLNQALVGDGSGGAWAGWAEVMGTDQPASYRAVHVDASDTLLSPGIVRGEERRFFLPATDGGLYTATLYGDGPYSDFSPPATTRAAYTPATSGTSTLFEETYSANAASYFGDGALVTLPHGGAIWFWSRVMSSTGLYARRFNGAGEVTSAPPLAAPSTLALTGARFDPAAGIRARASIAAPGSSRLEAFDTLGRRVASADIEGVGSRDVTLGGTRRLPPGLYLLRLSRGGAHVRARVVAIY